MRTATAALIWTTVLGASLGIHLAAFGGLGGASSDASIGKKRRPPTLVEMQIAKPKVAPPPASLPPPKAPATRLAVARPARSNAPRPAAPPQPADAPPPAAEAPADFTGTTLTSTNTGAGAGWASATGNGEAMRGPVGRPGAKVTGRSSDGAPPPAVKKREAPVVGLGDLSQPPQAPELASVLERFYPAEARRKGLHGKAVVRARVMPDGRLRELALVSESDAAAGFGEACRQTLDGSRWSAPVDRDGRPVSTFINYTCRFEVQ